MVHQRSLSIEHRPISSIQLDLTNPRHHSKKQIRQIANSIEAFGFIVPVLVDKRGQVVAGHGRILAAQFLGMAEIPTITLEHLTEPQKRAFMIADNRLTEKAAWDNQLLAEQLRTLSELDLNFSVDVTGFELSEIDLRIEGLAPAAEKSDPADVIPSATGQPQISRPGDVWTLGCHRILCGDSRNDACYAALMKGDLAQMVFADPPDNISIDGSGTEPGNIHHPDCAVALGEVNERKFADFLASAFRRLSRSSADGSLHFIFVDWRHLPEVIAAARPIYSAFMDLCIWVNESAGQGSLYRGQHELIFVFKNGQKTPPNNIHLGQFGRDRTNVWRYKRVKGTSGVSDEGNLTALHPTIKPVELVADAILDGTGHGDIVLDPFVGSGTTVIAAERTGRKCFGIELEPRYVDTIVRRWQAFTGQAAVLESTGDYFSDIAEGKNADRR